MKDLTESKVSSEQIFSGRLLDVRRDEVSLPEGGTSVREYIRHPGAVVMIPILPDGKILLIRQFRYPMGDVEIELPAVNLDYFISAQQRFRLSLQWFGIKAREKEFYLIPDRPGDLIASPKPPGPTDDFAFSQLSFQMRYRWEIAPLSDLFIVYTRTADQGRALGNASFSDLFTDAYDTPLGNLLVFKIRYRFGS